MKKLVWLFCIISIVFMGVYIYTNDIIYFYLQLVFFGLELLTIVIGGYIVWKKYSR